MTQETTRLNPQVAIVIGAGISGLSCAYELKQLCPKLDLRILEASSQPGGVIKTLKTNGQLIECGPESFSTLKPELVELAAKLGIKQKIIPTRQENRRSFVSLEHKLRPLPEGLMMFAPSNLWSFAFTDIFSAAGKIRMSMDLVLPSGDPRNDESLAQFVRRRLGTEALLRLAEPMIAGIYGGDPELLSAASTVPQLVELEKKHRSIIKGLMKARKQENSCMNSSGPRYGMLASFDDGISVLVESIVKSLPNDCLLTGKTVNHIMPGRNGSRWTVLCSDNSSYNADYIVLSTPAQKCAELVTEINPSLASHLRRISRSSAIIINLLYDRRVIKHALDGFGFVVPRSEEMLISACSFSSVKFEGRAAENKILLRLFTGGVLKSETMEMEDQEIFNKCHQELKELLGIESPPLSQFITRHSEAIPQYLVGHSQLISRLQEDLSLSPGIELAGNSYNGVGLPDCIKSAKNAAANIFREFQSRSIT